MIQSLKNDKEKERTDKTDENTRWHLLTEEKLNELKGKTLASLWESNRTIYCQ
jgi:hypothetical protein